MALLPRRCYGASVARELIGREIELDAALTAFATLPAVVALEGEAGIGKTSVWRVVLDQLEARDHAVLSARPAEAETHRLGYWRAMAFVVLATRASSTPPRSAISSCAREDPRRAYALAGRARVSAQ